jgi:hypothetical protein
MQTRRPLPALLQSHRRPRQAFAEMGARTKNDSRPLWIFLIPGAVIGLAVGIVVSVMTDVPLAPEIGLVVGLGAGWGIRVLRA